MGFPTFYNSSPMYMGEKWEEGRGFNAELKAQYSYKEGGKAKEKGDFFFVSWREIKKIEEKRKDRQEKK